MSFPTFRSLAGAAFLLSTAHGAQADVGAQDVWNNWQSYFEGLGYEVSSTQNTAGDTLTISDLAVTIPGTENIASSTVQFDQVAFTENSDGTVSIEMPQVTPFLIQMVTSNGKISDIEMEIRQSGLVSTVAGVPTELTNTFTAQSVDVVLIGVTIDGEEQDRDTAVASINSQGISGSIKSTIGGKRVYDQNMLTDAVKYDFAFTDPDSNASVKMNGQFTDLSSSGTSAVPLAGINVTDFAAMLAAGMSANGSFTYSAGNSNIAAIENGSETFSATTTSAGGTFEVKLNPEGLSYSGSQKELRAPRALRTFHSP